MDYSKINEHLSNLYRLRTNAKLKVSEDIVKQINDGDDEDEKHEFYDIGLDDGVVVKLTIVTDSYEEENIEGIQFGKGVVKKVTSFESI